MNTKIKSLTEPNRGAKVSIQSELGVNRFWLVPLSHLQLADTMPYWEELHAADYLKYRLSDTKEPTVMDAYNMMSNKYEFIHFCIDRTTGKIVGEVIVEPMQGKSAFVHFTVSPLLKFTEMIEVCKSGAHQILNLWKDSRSPDEPYVTSLVGLTPAQHRRVSVFLHKVGYKKQGMIKDGGTWMGEPADVNIYTLTSNDLE